MKTVTLAELLAIKGYNWCLEDVDTAVRTGRLVPLAGGHYRIVAEPYPRL